MKDKKSLSFVLSYESLQQNAFPQQDGKFILDGGLTSFKELSEITTTGQLDNSPEGIITTQPIQITDLENLQSFYEQKSKGLNIAAHESLIKSVQWHNFDQIEVTPICYSKKDIDDLANKSNYKKIIIQGYECKGVCGKAPQLILVQHAINKLKNKEITLYGPIGILGFQTLNSVGLNHLMLNVDWSLINEVLINKTNELEGRNSQLIEITDMNFGSYRAFIKSEYKKNWMISKKHSTTEIVAAKKKKIIIENGEETDYGKEHRIKYKTLGRLKKAYLKKIEVSPTIQLINERLKSKYPIIQGPMSRVSDNAEFAKVIADHGAIPTIAAAMMAPQKLDMVLDATINQVGEKAWGVGLLGFLESNTLNKQFDVIRKYKPTICILAGGVPAQAIKLEKETGIKTYIHAPTPELLALFLKQGARKFILEGRECGGHIGPLSSLSLWERSLEILSSHSLQVQQEVEIVFAGGIFNTVSAQIATGILRRSKIGSNVKFGILIGSAYLCTNEIVDTKATTKQYQDVSIQCNQTVYLETAAGHQSRCADTKFCEKFEEARNDLLTRGESPQNIAKELDKLILGKLRLASKGKKRIGNQLVDVNSAEQCEEGMYMVGDAVTLIDKTQSIKDLHTSINKGIEKITFKEKNINPKNNQPEEIAIIGMSVMLPTGNTIEKLWKSIANGDSCISKIPVNRWDYNIYSDSNETEYIHSRWGAFCEDIEIDLLKYGITPKSNNEIEPTQILALEATNWALEDAGYGEDSEYSKHRVSVSIGFSGGVGDKGQGYIARSFISPNITDKNKNDIDQYLDQWGSESFAGLLPNVIAGRIANRFNFGGTNCVSDAACASSLAAVEQGVNKLRLKQSDMCVVGGVDFMMSPFAYFCFSKTGALSPTGEVNSFSQNANGIVLGEGIGIIILKRLSDAESDGDKIYAVIKGVGSSSDGKEKSLTAPSFTGQTRAFNNAYLDASVDPVEIGMYEAHGTGTPVGDQSEANALKTIINEESRYNAINCSLGSVKTNIGHTKGSAGMIGLIKTTLCLYTQELLHHLPEKNGNKAIDEVKTNRGIRVLKNNLPWVTNGLNKKRKAGVSAFGFGGSNYHIVLEEYLNAGKKCLQSREIYIRLKKASMHKSLRGESPFFLLAELDSANKNKKTDATSEPINYREAYEWMTNMPRQTFKVCVGSKDYLSRLIYSQKNLEPKKIENKNKHDESEVKYNSNEQIIISCAGQGYQYPGYYSKVAMVNPESLDYIGLICSKLKSEADRFELISYLFDPEYSKKENYQLIGLQAAQVAYQYSWYKYYNEQGLEIEDIIGHSLGDYTCMAIAGLTEINKILELVLKREELINLQGDTEYKMYALSYQSELDLQNSTRNDSQLKEICYISNINSKKTLTIAIKTSNISKLESICKELKADLIDLEINQAFHTPEMKIIGARFREHVEKIKFNLPDKEIYLSTSPKTKVSPSNIASLLEKHLTNTVLFTQHALNRIPNNCNVNVIDLGPKKGLKNLIQDSNTNATIFNVDGPNFRIDNAKIQLKLFLQKNQMPKDNSIYIDEDSCNKKSSSSSYIAYVNGSHSKTRLAKDKNSYSIFKKLKLEDNNQETDKVFFNSKGEGSQNEKRQQDGDTEDAKIRNSEFSLRANSNSGKIMEDNGKQSQKLQAYLEFQKTIRHLIDSQNRVFNAFIGSEITTNKSFDKASNNIFAEDQLMQIHNSADQSNLDYKTLQASNQEEKQSNTILIQESEPTKSINSPVDCLYIENNLINILSEKTGYESSLLEPKCDLESDLGIDSIKRVEVLGELLSIIPKLTNQSREYINSNIKELRTIRSIATALYNELINNTSKKNTKDENNEIKNTSDHEKSHSKILNNTNPEDILNLLLNTMSDLSGYPEELLGVDMDLESELGIDSIKKVEVLGASLAQLSLTTEQREFIQSKSRDCKTLKQTANLIVDSTLIQPGKQ